MECARRHLPALAVTTRDTTQTPPQTKTTCQNRNSRRLLQNSAACPLFWAVNEEWWYLQQALDNAGQRAQKCGEPRILEQHGWARNKTTNEPRHTTQHEAQSKEGRHKEGRRHKEVRRRLKSARPVGSVCDGRMSSSVEDACEGCVCAPDEMASSLFDVQHQQAQEEDAAEGTQQQDVATRQEEEGEAGDRAKQQQPPQEQLQEDNSVGLQGGSASCCGAVDCCSQKLSSTQRGCQQQGQNQGSVDSQHNMTIVKASAPKKVIRGKGEHRGNQRC